MATVRLSSWCSRFLESEMDLVLLSGRAVPFRLGPSTLCSFSTGLNGWNKVDTVKNESISNCAGKEKNQKLWRDLFSNPSQWWDHRSDKGNGRFPDFKHKITGEALWLDNKWNPPWVASEIVAFKGESRSACSERLWRDLFSEPSKWWDHRPRKGNPRSPDFRQKQTGEVLWLDDRRTPSWVASKIPSLGPATLEAHVFLSVQKLSQYNKFRNYEKTMELYEQMQREGITADHYIFLHVLNACAALRGLEEGRRIHRQIIEVGCELNPHLINSLIDMYAKCGSLEDARNLFNKLVTRDVVSWTAMIQGSVKCGQGQEALELFQQMEQEGCKPDSTTFLALLNACSSVGALEEGRRVHKLILQSGCESHAYVSNSLIDMYAKCGSIEDAQGVFDKMDTRSVVSWTALIMGCVKCGQGLQALQFFRQMQQEGVKPDSVTFVVLLKACASMVALDEGRRVHKQIIQSGLESNAYIGSSLVDMYAKCGSIKDARRVFDNMPIRDVVSWTAMIVGFVNCGQSLDALGLFQQMENEGVEPDSASFVPLLNACASIAALEQGRRIHKQIIQSGFESDGYVGAALVDMYSKCGSLEEAWSVFNKMPRHNVVSWTAMILGCGKCDRGQEALDLFQRMQSEGADLDSNTFVALLNTCGRIGALEQGRCLHKQIIQRGYESDVYVGNSLVDMYAKCGSLEEAQSMFNNMPIRTVVSWSTMILGCVRRGRGLEALELFRQMKQEGVEPNSTTFVALLNACASEAALDEGSYLHRQIIESGFESSLSVGNSLVHMYAKCGSFEDARNVFFRMPARDVVTWTAMIHGCVDCKQGPYALELFQRMQKDGIMPNSTTFVGLLNACASLGALEEGRMLHLHIAQRGYESDAYVINSLLDMYTKCGSMEDAQSLFTKMPKRDVVSCTAMILGYVKCGKGLEALELFQQMQKDGVEPDSKTFVVVLNACAGMMALEKGRLVHEQIIQSGLESNTYIGTSLVDMYTKCGSLEEAMRVFNKISERNVVSWTSMIQGCVKCGQGREALELFKEMKREGVDPNSHTFVSLLNACASISALEEGRHLHRQIIQCGCEAHAHVSNSLVDMYSKCGSIKDAWNVFNKMSTRDVVSWTVMIMGYAIHGHAKEAIACFEQMVLESVKPNELVFVCLLSACSHGGLVEEGTHYFEVMKSVYGILPGLEHYTCMVDLFGRAGQLGSAENIVRTMHLEPCAAVWNSLLSACRNHGNMEMGKRAAEQVLKLDPDNVSGYLLLSNIYAAAGHFDSQEMVDKHRQERTAWKSPGCTWIEVENKVHSFVAHDRNHPQTKEIYTELEKLSHEMKRAGYVPDTRFALQNNPEDEKIRSQCKDCNCIWAH